MKAHEEQMVNVHSRCYENMGPVPAKWGEFMGEKICEHCGLPARSGVTFFR